MPEKIRVYFLGSGEIAVPVLKELAENPAIELAGCGTQPDKPAGRKRIMTPSHVGKWADCAGLKCERIKSVNTDEFIAHIAELAPDIIVVVSFGQILKERILNFPKLGCLNAHASILPELRGASPICSAILRGDTETGVSFMRMDRGLDTGPVYSILRMGIPEGITTDALEKRLAELAAGGIVGCIRDIADDRIKAVPQDNSRATVSHKIHKCDGSVRWNEDAQMVERRVRAYHPWPSMVFILNGARPMHVKIVAAKTGDDSLRGRPGEIAAVDKSSFTAACGKGCIRVERVVPEGKKEMSGADFVRGFHLKQGDVLNDGPGISATFPSN